jgi:predicted transposase YbfD/YdcC
MKVEDKSNEITALPPLLELLDITGSIITIDAMGTQTEIANKIIEKKGN